MFIAPLETDSQFVHRAVANQLFLVNKMPMTELVRRWQLFPDSQ
jgi:hypothetical protein